MMLGLLKSSLKNGKTKYDNSITQTTQAQTNLWLSVFVIVFLLWLVVSLGNALKETQAATSSVKEEIEQLRNDFNVKEKKLDQRLDKIENGSEKVTQAPTRPQVVRSSVPRNEVTDYIRAVFGAEADFALKVAKCESGYRTNAVGGAGERGIFQIHPVHAVSMTKVGFTWNQMFDYKANIRYAKMLHTWQGWKPWTCAKLV